MQSILKIYNKYEIYKKDNKYYLKDIIKNKVIGEVIELTEVDKHSIIILLHMLKIIQRKIDIQEESIKL